MINNPKLIQKIKEELKNTTKEQLEQAMELVDEEIYQNSRMEQTIEFEDNNLYCIEEKYTLFIVVHKKKTRRLFNKDKEYKKVLEAA